MEKMTAKIPNRELLEVPDALKEDFATLKPAHVLRDPFALPDPPPLLAAYHNVNLDVPDIPNSDEDDTGGDKGGDNEDVTPAGDDGDGKQIDGNDVDVDKDQLMSEEFWNECLRVRSNLFLLISQRQQIRARPAQSCHRNRRPECSELEAVGSVNEGGGAHGQPEPDSHHRSRFCSLPSRRHTRSRRQARNMMSSILAERILEHSVCSSSSTVIMATYDANTKARPHTSRPTGLIASDVHVSWRSFRVAR